MGGYGPRLSASRKSSPCPNSARRILRAPQHRLGAFLVGHAVGIADRLELQAPGRLEVEDRLAGGRSVADREHDPRGDTLLVEVSFGCRHVVDVEGDVKPADVAVLWDGVLLV